MFRRSALFVLLLLASMIPSMTVYGEDAERNLVLNGGFEEVNVGEPASWIRDAYYVGDDYSQMKVAEGDARTGSRFATIESLQPNDAKWTQTVSVEPDTLYKLSGWVRVARIDNEGATGANLSVLGIGTTSPDKKSASGSWELLELIGRTGAEQLQLTVAVRIGGYGSLNSGKADFDDFRMERLDEAPSGVSVVSFDPVVAQGDGGTVPGPSELASSHAGYSGWMVFYGLAYAALGFYLISRFRNPKANLSDRMPALDKHRVSIIVLLFGGALLLRIVCAPIIQGHPIDIFDFMAWADRAYHEGLGGFYNGEVFADYPPGYIYVLYALGMIKSWLGLDPASSTSIILIKFPAIVADLLAGLFIYRLALRHADARSALLAALLYVLNPLVFLDSVVWGQMDSVFALFIVIMVYSLHIKRLPTASALFMIAVLIKPQSFMFAPLLLFSIRSWKETAKAVVYALVAFIVVTLPFALQQGPWWIFKHYQAMFGMYPYATFNAFNGYALLGANGVETSRKWWGIPFAGWDILFILAIVGLVGVLMLRSRKDGKIIYAAFLIAVLVFAFKTGLHERYGYMTIPLALMSWIWIRDVRVFGLFLGVTLTNFANVAYVLKYGLSQNYFIPNGNGFMNLVSLGNVFLAGYAAWIGYELFIKKPSSKPIQSIKPKPVAAAAPPSNVTMTRKDYFAMVGITFVYAAIALFQLGSTVAPQSFWKAGTQGESAIADFGAAEQVKSILWYGGIGNGSFQVEQSEDGIGWTPVTTVDLNDGSVFQWKKVQASFTARFVKIAAVNPGASLGEIGFRGTEKQLVPFSDSTSTSPAFDEQGSVPKLSSFKNSMYFDEIYHARTAYENIHRMEPYETTHPPLGKVLISSGVALLGMNPFGWRIAGVLFGIAIVPLLYAFGKRLFRETRYAALASILVAFDFMLFTQSRLATVDTFAVFFILLAYERMHRYYEMNFHRDKLLKTIPPLAISGLAFGLATATKWIGLYAGAGLAILFFLSLWNRYKEYRENRQLPFANHALWTILYAGLFFVVVPLMIYLASYIPFLLVPGPGHGWKDVLSYQQFMYSYHSKLVATHPFSSTWWEWPLIRKPIWYYGGSELPASKMASIVAMGNPAVWWVGTIAVIATLRAAWKKQDSSMAVVLVGIGAAYLPWVLVPRLTFIYHFFACVPFIVLCIVYWIRKIEEGKPENRKWTHLYAGAVVLLFLLYYPILSGTEIYVSYADGVLKWFDGWIFHG
ncbi:phospholipid carrier-dependent glycosyltransferase [Cohnella herbarum]|uniref:Polyprenol-phosphate-mannose--protein mannosyltransferase n=1 Tax=Cohnella herbarum TaxID=2728023 RepID=A0A7Z2VH04_9BACL|nr:phospholipid carrier-dependent glycosyltransferase [Cohnella herbarum]QJD83036.1 phospholipid carrier-dependent glycosyltransferase [Cohnella herbarum]